MNRELAKEEFASFGSEECKAGSQFAIVRWEGPSDSDQFKFNAENDLQPLPVNDEEETEEPTIEEKAVLVCNPTRLKDILDRLAVNPRLTQKRTSAILLPDEHIKGKPSAKMHVFLYSDFTQASFEDWIFALKFPTTLVSPITTYLRYLAPESSGRVAFLQGYGAELAIKSTEYRVVDDTTDTIDSAPKDLPDAHEDDQLRPLKRTELAGKLFTNPFSTPSSHPLTIDIKILACKRRTLWSSLLLPGSY